MSKFKPQYKRLLFIDRKIREGAFPNCSQLATEWETSTRTMQRDIDYLKYELDAPIEYDAIKHGFYYADPTWFLPSVMLSEGDLMALLIGQQAMHMYRGTPVADELQRIYSKLADLLPETIAIGPEFIQARFSFLNPPSRPIKPDIWKVLLRSLLHQKVLEMTYRSPGMGKLVPHRIHPYHVVNLEGDWYVLAGDERWGDVAQYAISRFARAKLTDQSFTVPGSFDANAFLKNRFGRNLHTGRSKTTLVRLLIDPKLANYVTEKIWHPRQKLIKKSDGVIELQIPVLSTRDIEPWILSLAENVKVLEPLELRKNVQSRHRKAART